MSEPLQDWASEWNQPDPRITTLKQKLDSLDGNVIQPAILPIRNDVEDLKAQMAELFLYHKIRLLYEMDKIDKAELIRLYTMLHSEDPENRKLAIEIINKIK